jgi:hypothetical protein
MDQVLSRNFNWLSFTPSGRLIWSLRLLHYNASINVNPMRGFSLVIVIPCPCNPVGNGAIMSGSFAMLTKLEK